MINSIHIENYKCIEDANIEFKPLTIVTGLNSTGKSTLLQAVLLANWSSVKQFKISQSLSTDFEVIRCKNINKERILVKANYSNGTNKLFDCSSSSITFTDSSEDQQQYGINFFYLKSVRGIGNFIWINNIDKTKVDFSDGTGAFYIYELEKTMQVIPELRKYEESDTLQAQLNFWLSYITSQNIELSTEKSSEEMLFIKYKSNGIPNISPLNLGTGVTYLAEVLITCLRAKKDDVVVIENPEIHLHPLAQAKLGEFLAFIANAGIQVIVETHCEHLINRVQYEVYKHNLSHDAVTILYKKSTDTPFEEIRLKKGGNYTVDFPDGFFDATLTELMDME